MSKWQRFRSSLSPGTVCLETVLNLFSFSVLLFLHRNGANRGKYQKKNKFGGGGEEALIKNRTVLPWTSEINYNALEEKEKNDKNVFVSSRVRVFRSRALVSHRPRSLTTHTYTVQNGIHIIICYVYE